MRVLLAALAVMLLAGAAQAAPLSPTNDAGHRYGWLVGQTTFQGAGEAAGSGSAADGK
jgi:hypothetical protein